MNEELTQTVFTPTKAPWSLKGLVATSALDEEGAELLKDAVTRGHNILVCGPNGSGRTTVLEALAQALEEPFVHVAKSPAAPAVPGFRAGALQSGYVYKTRVVESDALASFPLARLAVSSRRGATGALAEVFEAQAALRKNQDPSDGARLLGMVQVVEHYSVVVTCGRRAAVVDGKEVKRRVVTSIDAVESVGTDGVFQLTPLLAVEDAQSDEWSGGASREALARQALRRANGDTAREFFDMCATLHAAWPTDIDRLASKISTYKGSVGSFADNILTLAGADGRLSFSDLSVLSIARGGNRAVLDALDLFVESKDFANMKVTDCFRRLAGHSK